MKLVIALLGLLLAGAPALAAGTLTITFQTAQGQLSASRTLSDADVTRLLDAYQPGGGPPANAFAAMVQSWVEQTIAFVKTQEAAAATATTQPIGVQ